MIKATIGLLAGILLVACAEVRFDTDSHTGSSDANGPTDSEFDSNSDDDVNTGVESDTGLDTLTDTDAGSGSGMGSDTDTDTLTDTDTELGTDTLTDTVTELGTDTLTDTDLGTELGTDTLTDTDLGSDYIEVSFSERIDSHEFLVDKGAHRLLIGPSTSNNPEDGTWVVLRNEAQMQNLEANQAWAAVAVDAGPAVQAHGWTSFRLAFHYDGTNADNWWLDDICVRTSIDSCDLFEQAFSTVQVGALPYEWRQVKGVNNQSMSDAWQVDNKAGTSDRAMTIMWSSERMSRYLVTRNIYVL